MRHRAINLSSEFHDIVQSRVENGRYENANEVIRAALHALVREEKASKNDRSARNISEDDVFRPLWEASASSLRKTRSSNSGNHVAQQ
jgi:putative addiction module CopG family antidote